MNIIIVNTLSFLITLLGYAIFGFEPIAVVLLFLIYVRLD